MVKSTKYTVKLFLSLFVLLILGGCANQLPPSGGDVDRIPPEIISAFPENGTTNYRDDYVELEFSEYVDKRSFKDAIFISPTIEEQLEIDWSGKSVKIFFPKGLKKDFTYVVTIGTDVVDLNNKNRMANSYSFSFSTGDNIDKRTVEGRVYGKNIEGTLIFAYKFSSDTINYLAKKPDYISQIGKDGGYKLNGLAESVYRIFAVKDQLRDFIYQSEQDFIGMPFENVTLTGKDSSFTGLNFFINKIDTMRPRLISTIMTDRYHILVTLTEDCDTSIYKATNYFIFDSTSNSRIKVDYCYQGNTKKDELILVQKQELNPSNRYFLFAKKLEDLNKNVFENDWRELIVSDKPDTTASKLYKKLPDENAIVDFIDAKFVFYFDDAIQNMQIKDAIEFEDTIKNKIPFEIKFPDDATLIVSPLTNLKPDKRFEIKLDLSKFSDAAGNKVDSIFTLKFSTISGVEFTGLSGKIKTSLQNVVLILQDITDPNNEYITKPDKTSAYNFTRIQPGKYLLWYYSDSDSNEIYDNGYPHPFKYAEEFYFYQDTIKLRPRWSITDFNIFTK